MTDQHTPNTPKDVHDPPRSFATLLDRGYERVDFLLALKDLIAAAEERIRQEHDAGGRGRNVVRHLTALVDDVVRTVFRYVQAQKPPGGLSCSVIALGGYGRGELNPHSDIDLMFLFPHKPPDHLVRETLYLLWDVGYTLGHSVRSRRDAVHMAQSDLTAQTAMMESRFVDGDQRLFEWFQEEVCHRRFTKRWRRLFVRQKSGECRQRHASFANTVNLMEPNIKESPGGLRDYHTALWLGMAGYEAGSLEALTDQGLISATDRDAIETALDFLFRVRNALHYHHGRKNDLLSVDVQEKLAAALGFEPSPTKRAVEHFLNAYYVHANVLHDLCCTLIEAVSRSYQPRFWQFVRRPQHLNDNFMNVHGYLTCVAPSLDAEFAEHPLRLMQAFTMSQEHQLPLAPELSLAIKSQASALATESVRRSPEAKALFFDILAQPQAAATLRAMHRHGLIEAYIPEFGALTCLVQYDLYHRYTVDEHSLRGIEVLETLSNTDNPTLRPLTRLYRQTADKALLKFALLLHDLGKDMGPGKASHVYRSGELAEIVCARLDLSDDQQHLIQILVVNHLVMNHLAQRRDITDPKVIAEFATTVETVSNLEQLYLLTFADTSAVGPGVWTAWKGALLGDLYQRTRDYLVYQTDMAPSKEDLYSQLRPIILEALEADYDAALVDRFLDTMSAKYLMATPPDQIAKHIRLTQTAPAAPLVVHTEQAAGFTDVTICVEGRRGVFSMIAGALSRNRLNILGAQIYTSSDGLAVDTLQVETDEGAPVTDTRLWQRVEADLQAALDQNLSFDDVLTQRRNPIYERKYQTFAQPPRVVIDNTISDSYTVVEIQTQDRLGLLYKLTHLLYEQGIDIALAKISTEANRAIDVFYVTDATGNKLTNATDTDRIQGIIMEALQ